MSCWLSDVVLIKCKIITSFTSFLKCSNLVITKRFLVMSSVAVAWVYSASPSELKLLDLPVHRHHLDHQTICLRVVQAKPLAITLINKLYLSWKWTSWALLNVLSVNELSGDDEVEVITCSFNGSTPVSFIDDCFRFHSQVPYFGEKSVELKFGDDVANAF